MIKLKNPYISVKYDDFLSFGGNQRLAESKIIKNCGCGLVAALDLLIYLSKTNKENFSAEVSALSLYSCIPAEKYNSVLNNMLRSYFPLIPGHGMNGLGLMAGMQLYLRRYSLPYSCHWCVSDKGLWNKVKFMLGEDIPVIISIGPNFPWIWKNKKLPLYIKDNNGEYKHISSVNAHFITITGMDDKWLEISSWGQRFYINRRMYEEYVSVHSAAFVSNILYVKKKVL